LAFHAGLGSLLVLGSLWLAVVAIRGRRAGFVWAAVLCCIVLLALPRSTERQAPAA
jgi:hypothetical protein